MRWHIRLAKVYEALAKKVPADKTVGECLTPWQVKKIMRKQGITSWQ